MKYSEIERIDSRDRCELLDIFDEINSIEYGKKMQGFSLRQRIKRYPQMAKKVLSLFCSKHGIPFDSEAMDSNILAEFGKLVR